MAGWPGSVAVGDGLWESKRDAQRATVSGQFGCALPMGTDGELAATCSCAVNQKRGQNSLLPAPKAMSATRHRPMLQRRPSPTVGAKK